MNETDKNEVQLNAASRIFYSTDLSGLDSQLTTKLAVPIDLVYFTTRVPDTSATRAEHDRHECDTSATRVLHQRHECDTSATQTTQVRHE